ncbi:RagB/SusD family nutrient uptake outer membrane protein [Marinilongibacter aquaticus]|uniref:RagB/SusD family nutrient uptake outer membrane protein n=1 Tax=Marinilongibacter aquaticus TaxID=2975157 RepID=UPI0021BDA3CE|nr:RagB/SusD family nutrient uptake outer membrane protein [Marinilongibacter aquaticus]UBM58034.1 RagB/SusD family nutrient uptake outer membrane protein [Marinilongibacter aquaticus]
MKSIKNKFLKHAGKWLRYGLLPAVFMLSGQSCKDALDEVAISDLSNDYINSAKGFNDAVTSAYGLLRAYYAQEINMTLSQMGTDTFTQGADGSYKRYNLYTADLDGRDNWVRTLWREYYRGINTCNAIIGRAENVSGLSDSEKTLGVAEAKALRALYYFTLVQHYGGLDLRLVESEGPITDISRTNESAVYDSIIKDFNEAMADLPTMPSAPGRFSKMAIEGFLCKVHITRATRDFGSSDDYAKAEMYGKHVIENYDRELLSDYADIFDLDNNVNPEVVFAVQFSYDLLSAGGYGNRWHLYYLMEYDTQPGMSRVLQVGRPWKRLRPTDYTYNQVMVNRDVDSRYDKSFKKVFYATKTGTFPTFLDKSKAEITVAEGDTAIFMPGYEMSEAERAKRPYQVYTPSMYNEKQFGVLAKFLDPRRATINEERGGRDFNLIRLADVYLLVAEALIQQNKNQEAVDYINPVRRRAAYPGHEDEMEIDVSKATMDFLMDERARELLGEGHRWTDLKRWNKLVERVKMYNDYGSPNIDSHHMYRPIPQEQIDLVDDPSAFPQNDGY